MSTKRNPPARPIIWARVKMLAAILALLGALAGMAGGGGGGSKAATPAAPAQPGTSPSDPETVVTPDPEADVVVEPVTNPDPVVVPQPTPTTPVVVVEPTPEPAPEPDPVVVVEPTPDPVVPPVVVDPTPDPEPPTDPVVVEPSGPPTLGSFNATATAGRVTTLEIDNAENLVGVKIISGPDYGNVTVNPDNTLALVLTGTSDTTDLSFSFEATYADGTSTIYDAGVDVSAGSQAGGWGMGEFYMLQTDQDNNLVVEHGFNHVKVHISGDNDALSLQDIANLEGINVSEINGKWFESHSEYGADPDMALAEDAGRMLWSQLTGTGTEPSSHWLLFEAGHEYSEMGPILDRGTTGESELNPIYVGSYGNGEQPIISSPMNLAQDGYENVVFQGIEFTGGIRFLRGENIAFDDISITGEEAVFQNIENITFRNADVTDVVHEVPNELNATIWSPHVNRMTGIYGNNNHGMLLEDLYLDHNAWADDYEADLSLSGGMPPSLYSHNIYLNYGNSDVTLRDTITARGASFGAQVRSGGFIENNVFLDNNAGVNFLGGTVEDGVNQGNYTLFMDNVVTSGAHKEVTVGPKGGLTIGAVSKAADATLINNIITHLADPNDPADLAGKYTGHQALNLQEAPLYNDTIIYNWVGGRNVDKQDQFDQNIDGLNTSVLDATTIQNFAADLLGDPDATIADLAEHLRAQADGALADVVDADLIIAFFQKGFGIEVDLREDAGSLRFVPNHLGDGVRWDNSLNWDSGYLPGSDEGPAANDSVDLGGNWVNYGGTTTIENLDLGEGGKLNVTHGYLEVDGDLNVGDTGGALDIDGAGQIWLSGYGDDDLLKINVDGGRFANTGLVDGTVEVNITDNAQVLLGTDDDIFAVDANSSLTIDGDDSKVGFDGEEGGTGVLLLNDNSTLSYIADQDGLGQVSEFYSGHFDTPKDGSGIQSGVNLGNADLHIDVSALAGGIAISETLITVDDIIGSFDEIVITGLGNTQDAKVWYDYDADTVTLTLSAAGTGTGAVSTVVAGDETNAQANDDLWAALTSGHGTFAEDAPEDDPLDGMADSFIL
ncbi:hypothetical protein [Litoreibacter meonggei]|nr:hypothetical protein [Litoreibacter meonggei]